MLFVENLEKIVFQRHQTLPKPDCLTIVSGYVGPRPIENLCNLPMECKVIYGMYGAEKIRPRLHESLLQIQSTSLNTKIYYSTLAVHSKCYIWARQGEIVHALIGSANFSMAGLRTDFREVLAETTSDTYRPLKDYCEKILDKSLFCENVTATTGRPLPPPPSTRPQTTNLLCMTLLDRNGNMPSTSGLNWGQNPTNHTDRNDAYIAVRTGHIRQRPLWFPAKRMRTSDSRGRSSRENDPIEIIWDDGTTMEGLLEGSQPIDGVPHPKQISTFPHKRDLGLYLRSRLGVASGHMVTHEDLNRYGRTDIEVEQLGEGVYSFNFAPPNS